MSSLGSDPDCAGFAGYARVPDVDVVVAGGQIATRIGSEPEVSTSAGVVEKSPLPQGGIQVARIVGLHGIGPGCCVVVTTDVVE